MRRWGWLVVATSLLGCSEESKPPPPLAGGYGGPGGSAPMGGGADPGTGTDGTGTDSGTDGATTGDGSGTAGSTGSGIDPCAIWAAQYVECQDPAADEEALILECSALTSDAFLNIGPDCAYAIGDTILCIAELDCAAFVAYDGGHGLIPPQCETEVDAQNLACAAG